MNPGSVLRLFSRKSGLCAMGIARRTPQHLKMSTSASIEQQREKTYKSSFEELFPTILDTVTKRSKMAEVPEVADWLKKVLEYNLLGGKLARGITTTIAYETIAGDNVTEENLKISKVLGWCIEMLHAYFLIMDDIMDGSSRRRGLPCWYTLPHVGVTAINDSILVHACIFETLKAYAAHLPLYPQIVDLMNESLLYTTMGQHLDITMAHRSVKDYSLFTPARYAAIIRYKTSYYTYKLPVGLGLYVAGVADPAAHRRAEEICLQIGHLFQMQDDYIDCYGAEHAGKDGTDIQERKCSWLAVTALSKCTAKQRLVFETCYGSAEPAHVERVKRLYDELDLPAVYKAEERQRYEEVMRSVHQLDPAVLPPDLFVRLLNMINKRKV